MNMSFCFESSGACLLSFKLLEDTLLPKVLCSWDSTPGEVFITCICTLKKKWRLTCVIYMYVAYAMSNKNYYFICSFMILTDFSLNAWKTGKGLIPADPLPSWAQSELFEELGMAQYLTPSACARGSGLFVDSKSGTNNIGFNTNSTAYSQCKSFNLLYV